MGAALLENPEKVKEVNNNHKLFMFFLNFTYFLNELSSPKLFRDS